MIASGLVLRFSPARFMITGKTPRVHLRNLVLTYSGSELDKVQDAWSSGPMDPGYFRPGSRGESALDNTTAFGNGNIRREIGRIVIGRSAA